MIEPDEEGGLIFAEFLANILYVLEPYNQWPHVTNCLISISQLLSL